MNTCLKKTVSNLNFDCGFSRMVKKNDGTLVVPSLNYQVREDQNSSIGFPAPEFFRVVRGPGLCSVPRLVKIDTKIPFPFGRNNAINNLSPEEMERLMNT